SSASAVFDLGGGKVFTYAGSWCADGFRTSWEGSWRIVAERGSLLWDGHDGLKAEVIASGRDGIIDKTQPIDVPALGIIQDFMRAIETGTEPETRGTDNIKSLAMVFGAIESAETGRRVAIATQEG
ncbi:MAG: gfo/Idh/MocA family oxidoreductase, partial [Mesorhizobium sp.]